MFATVRPPAQNFAGLVEDGRYGIELVRFEDEGVSIYAKPEDQNPSHRIRWVFHLYTGGSRVPLRTPEGEVFEMFAWTSDRTGAKSSARPWFEALLGRPLVVGDGGDALVAEAVGKKAWAMIGTVRKPGQDGGLDRDVLQILSMSPLKPGAATPPAEPAPPMRQMDAVRAANHPQGDREALGDDDIPF